MHMKFRNGRVRRDATCTSPRHDASWQNYGARGHPSGFEHWMRISRSTAIGTEDEEHELRDTSSFNSRSGPPSPGTDAKKGAFRRRQERTQRDARPIVARHGRKGWRGQKDEIEDIPLLKSMMNGNASDALLCSNIYP